MPIRRAKRGSRVLCTGVKVNPLVSWWVGGWYRSGEGEGEGETTLRLDRLVVTSFFLFFLSFEKSLSIGIGICQAGTDTRLFLWNG